MAKTQADKRFLHEQFSEGGLCSFSMRGCLPIEQEICFDDPLGIW